MRKSNTFCLLLSKLSDSQILIGITLLKNHTITKCKFYQCLYLVKKFKKNLCIALINGLYFTNKIFYNDYTFNN